ncbi:hypothetical protein [Pseudomonas putida]|uniref:hypothetical protein n=1 Tax=Pseudomonas putida TaxID=303 RepID=UPI0015763D07|nr:hypothetical protein [Pseudomonas putida]MCC9005680.1 hypothetical protein [Pseudomonas putida]
MQKLAASVSALIHPTSLTRRPLPDLATQLIIFETLVRFDEALCKLDVAVKKTFLWSQPGRAATC